MIKTQMKSPPYRCFDTRVITPLTQISCRMSSSFENQYNKLDIAYYRLTKHLKVCVKKLASASFITLAHMLASYTPVALYHPSGHISLIIHHIPSLPPPPHRFTSSHLCLMGPERDIHETLSKMTSCSFPRHRWQ